jgi:hypothetical protein
MGSKVMYGMRIVICRARSLVRYAIEMDRRNGAYEADYPVGTTVRIKDVAELRAFQRTWKLHNPLSDEQLQYAGEMAIVQEVGFYHGGDERYTLAGVPGMWYERCVRADADGSGSGLVERGGQRARDIAVICAAAGLFVLLAGGIYAGRALERESADLHGPVALIVLAPVILIYTVGALLLAATWMRNKRTMPAAVRMMALAPTVVLLIAATRACFLRVPV